MESVTVRAPASAANLGPGFDTLGLALALHNELRFTPAPGEPSVTIRGEGEGQLDTGPGNLVCRAMRRLYAEVGRQGPPVCLELVNRIPLSRGLGSSSAAIVGGLVGANALLGSPLEREALLALAVEMEGHPDNVTPALLGGLQVTASDDSGVCHLRVEPPRGLAVVICIPDVQVSTETARRALPQQYSREDAVFNLGRVAILVASMALGKLEHLRSGMEDRIHQPYRAPLIPGFGAAVDGAIQAGAAGACLSGSGSTILALVDGRTDGAGARAARIGEAMVDAVQHAGHEALWTLLEPDLDGTVVVPSA